jgi:hypothetical protein
MYKITPQRSDQYHLAEGWSCIFDEGLVLFETVEIWYTVGSMLSV